MKHKPMSEVESFLAPIAEETGVELAEAVWDDRTHTLTLYIDRPEGIDLVTCERFHLAVEAPLDDLDPTYGAPYTLNCSSLGLDRPFKGEKDFLRHMGEKIEVHLYAPFEGAKYHEGKLCAFEEGTVVLEKDGKTLRIPFDKCSRVCLLIEV